MYGPPAVRNSGGAVIVTCAADAGGIPGAPLGATLGSRGGTPAGGAAPGGVVGGAVGVTVGAAGTVPGAAPGGKAPTGAIGRCGRYRRRHIGACRSCGPWRRRCRHRCPRRRWQELWRRRRNRRRLGRSGTRGSSRIISRWPLDQRRRPGQPDVLLRADIHRRQVVDRQLVRPDDVRRQQHHDVGLADLVARRAEERPQARHAHQADHAGDDLPLIVLEQAGEQVGLALAQPQPRLHAAGAERRDVLPGDADVRPEVAALDGEVDDDLALVGHTRRHRDVDADVTVGERRLRDVGESAGRGGAEHGRDDRDLIAEVEGQLSALRATQLRLGQLLRPRIGLQETQECRRHRRGRNRTC